jgi:hypothetical protein
MRNYFFLLPAAMLLFACGQQKQSPKKTTEDQVVADSVAIVNDPYSNLNIQALAFSEIDSSGILMFPLAQQGREGRSGTGSLSYKEIPANNYWNIIFLNTKTNEYHLLSERKMLISNYQFNSGNSSKIIVEDGGRFIFYSIITDDYNLDMKLNSFDPSYLFMSDRAGNNFRQISPPAANLLNWQFIEVSGKIIMTVQKDRNADKTFDAKDEVATFEIAIDKDAAPKEVFSNEFKNKLKLSFNRNWSQESE